MNLKQLVKSVKFPEGELFIVHEDLKRTIEITSPDYIDYLSEDWQKSEVHHYENNHIFLRF